MEERRLAPFDRIDAAQEYLALLSQTVTENKGNVDAAVAALIACNDGRCLDVLKLISYNLELLDKHLKVSRRTLNNLRKLQRLLLAEGASEAPGDVFHGRSAA